MPDHSERRRTVLALHGFTLNGAMFDEVATLLPAAVVAPDLPGHGGRDAAHTDWDAAVAEVADRAAEHRPDLVLGYSMGGRLALAAALAAPRFFSRLVLVSTSLGIEDPAVRSARHHDDWRRARHIGESGIAEFLDSWNSNPLLQSKRRDLAALRTRSTAAGIIGALRGMGQGEQPYLLPRLQDLEMPVSWVAGGRDQKYVAIARRAAGACRRGSLTIVDGALHNVIADAPEAVAQIVVDQLSLRSA